MKKGKWHRTEHGGASIFFTRENTQLLVISITFHSLFCFLEVCFSSVLASEKWWCDITLTHRSTVTMVLMVKTFPLSPDSSVNIRFVSVPLNKRTKTFIWIQDWGFFFFISVHQLWGEICCRTSRNNTFSTNILPKQTRMQHTNSPSLYRSVIFETCEKQR